MAQWRQLTNIFYAHSTLRVLEYIPKLKETHGCVLRCLETFKLLSFLLYVKDLPSKVFGVVKINK